MDLPPGFRFQPTDEEIIIHYLVKKVLDRRFSARAIEEADLNKCEPWDLSLTKEEKMGEKQWFFCKKDRKYPTGMRINRATESGYWKATGKDKEIYNGKKCLVGMKKTLVFYKGRAPKGDKTNWVMHEYRLEGTFCSTYSLPITAKEEWAVCRIFHKNSTGILSRNHPGAEISRMDSFTEQHFLGSPTLPPLMDVSDKPSSSFTSESIKQNSSSALIPEQNPNSYNQIGIPISSFPRHASLDLPFQHQDRISSMLKLPRATFPLREFDQTGLRIEAQNQGVLDPGRATCKIEQFSTTNTMINVPHDTAEMTNKMTTVASKGETEREKALDDFEGLSFSPIISDLDYLWSY